MSEPAVIQTRALTRYFGEKCAVDQITLRVPRGSVFAMLGRNGSGKSTLIRMLLGSLEPTRGSALVLGEDCRRLSPAVRGRVGYVAEGHPLIDWMRVNELEAFQRGSSARWSAGIFKTVAVHFGLDGRARASNLSRGERAGLSLALSLATDPELLIMDDPAMGLDPVARRTMLEAMILLTRDAGRTIFFTSHELADIERVADHIAILDRSVLRVSSSLEVFHARLKQFTLTFAGDAPALPAIPGLLQARHADGELRLTLVDYGPAAEGAIRSLMPASIAVSPLSLQDAVTTYLGGRGEQVSLLHKVRGAAGERLS